MMEEAKVLSVLDLLSDRAREFVQVSKEILEGERALQAHDGIDPTEWQVCSIISAFINYLGESERCRYGHFAPDLEARNNENKRQTAGFTLGRMKMFWERDDTDDLTDEQIRSREELVQKFLANDASIRRHLVSQPDVYQEGVPQETHREWMIRLRILGETEARLLNDWDRLLRSQRPPQTSPSSQQQP